MGDEPEIMPKDTSSENQNRTSKLTSYDNGPGK